jgi:hypothetical protein
MEEYGLGWTGSGQGQVAGFCECSDGQKFVTSWGSVRISRGTQLLGFSGIDAPGMACVCVCVCVAKRRCALLHWPNAGESMSRGLHSWCGYRIQSLAVNLPGQMTVFVYASLVSQIGVISGAAFVLFTPSGVHFSVCTVRYLQDVSVNL